MLSGCKYKMNGRFYSFDQLWTILDKVQLEELNSTTDILYSKYPRQEAQKKAIEEIKVKAKESSNNQLDYLLNGDISYSGENKEIAISTFLNQSPEAMLNGRPIVQQFSVEELRESEIRNRTKNLGMSQEEAQREVDNIIKNWGIVAEDSKDLHKLLTDPIIAIPEDKKAEFIQRAKNNLDESSKLYDDKILGQLYDGLKDFYIKTKGKFEDSEVIRNFNLTAQLRNVDTKLFGHIDYAFIDQFGNLQIYNFKITSTSPNKWSRDKKESYRYELAFLKQMLANNGINIDNINMNIVPLQVNYSPDYRTINGLNINESKNYDYSDSTTYTGTKYDNDAKFFIESNTSVGNITSEVIETADNILKAIFPFINIKSNIIGKTVDDLIENAPTVGESEPLIIREEQPGQWKVFINGTPHEISDPTSKNNNKEIKALVLKHIDKLNTNGSYINTIKNYILEGYRKGFIKEEDIKQNSTFISGEFHKYVQKRKLSDDTKYQEYELLDDLIDCNILLFKHKKTGVIDVITLSQQNLNVLPKYPKYGATNILGNYKLDSQIDMMYGDMGAIEAIRTLTLLNQVIDSIPNAKLGMLKIISQYGYKKIYDIQHTSDNYLKEIFKVIKTEVRDVPDFKYNFKQTHFTDPVDNLIREYHSIVQNNNIGYGKIFGETIGLEELVSAKDKNQRRVALQNIAEHIQQRLGRREASAIEQISRDPEQSQMTRDLAKLYMLVTDAYLNYSGENLEYNKPISEVYEFATTAPTVPSENIRIVVNNLQTTLDSIAEDIETEYTKHMRSFLMEFYKESGYSDLENMVIGDQNRLFKNLYQTDSDGNKIMKFKNPYINQGDNRYLTPVERKFLKKALFEFNRIRLIKRKDVQNFTSYEDPKIAEYISNNPNGEQYLWVPLKRASKTSQRQNISAYMNNFKKKVSRLMKMNGKQTFDEFVNDLSPEERQILDQDINELSIHNPMIEWERDPVVRQDKINKLGVDYFESNVEDLLLNFLARSVETEKFQKFLVGTKMLMLKLDMLGGESVEKELKYIEDYIKVNVFQKSVMENNSQEIIGALTPVRKFVTYANLAGNAVAYLRDIENGFLENFLRTATKFQTDISAANLTKAYGYVMTHGSANPTNINILSKLCVRYRLSNTDLSRITERLKSNRGGIFNWDNWAFSTLRSPDFLNRMTMFVAKAMQDGCFDAWYIENDELKYNWRKDKRFEIYAGGEKNKSHPDYAKQKGLYMMKIQEWNQEHPDKKLEYSDDLPSPYSNQDILAIKNVSNNIYGSYDRSLRSMGENKALGWVFAMYTTWMNGIWNNWFMKPGKYNIHQMNTVIETNENGEELWMDENGNQLTQKIDEHGNKKYINEDTGEEGTPDVPIYKKQPVIVQGIMYTFKDMFGILKDDGLQATKDYLRGNEVAKKNIRHAVSQALIALLHLMLIQLFLKGAYENHKKHAKEYSVATNIMAELGYKSFRQAGDSFRGPYNILDYVGDSNPPLYKVPTKLMGDAAQFVLGDKSFRQLVTGNFAIARAYRDTSKIYENSK